MSQVRDVEGTLAAGERRKIPLRGSFFYLRFSSAPLLVELQLIELGTKTGKSTMVRMKGGDKITPQREYDSVVLFNDSAVSVDYETTGGDGDYDRPIPDIVNVQVTSDSSEIVTTEVDETNIDVGNAGAIELVPADPNRIYAIITALSTNAEEIRIGDSNVDTDRGTPLGAGDTIKWSSKAACYAGSIATINQGAAKTIFSVS